MPRPWQDIWKSCRPLSPVVKKGRSAFTDDCALKNLANTRLRSGIPHCGCASASGERFKCMKPAEQTCRVLAHFLCVGDFSLCTSLRACVVERWHHPYLCPCSTRNVYLAPRPVYLIALGRNDNCLGCAHWSAACTDMALERLACRSTCSRSEAGYTMTHKHCWVPPTHASIWTHLSCYHALIQMARADLLIMGSSGFLFGLGVFGCGVKVGEGEPTTALSTCGICKHHYHARRPILACSRALLRDEWRKYWTCRQDPACRPTLCTPSTCGEVTLQQRDVWAESPLAAYSMNHIRCNGSFQTGFCGYRRRCQRKRHA